MFKRLIELLNQPYPDCDDNRSIFRNATLAGLVIFSVLYFLRPLGFDHPQPFMICMAYGGVSTVVALLFDLFLKYILRIRRDTQSWTLWKWLIQILVLILLISLVNLALLLFLNNEAISISNFLMALYSTFIIGLFPIFIFGTANVIRHLKANQKIASDITLRKEHTQVFEEIQLPILKSSKSISVIPSEIRFVESMQNYISIYLHKDGVIQKEVIRNTLTSIEKLLLKTSVKRCHRSFMVNMDLIEKISGNAQGLKLTVKDIDEVSIPVSRKYVAMFRE